MKITGENIKALAGAAGLISQLFLKGRKRRKADRFLGKLSRIGLTAEHFLTARAEVDLAEKEDRKPDLSVEQNRALDYVLDHSAKIFKKITN